MIIDIYRRDIIKAAVSSSQYPILTNNCTKAKLEILSLVFNIFWCFTFVSYVSKFFHVI